ncbi:condensin-2 complex subunit G2 [Parambassis ranga]|uniref:Condensin-2 complex subunit G2 n=1 Tax=Parambassis ranga TaxID=210632 RepID=A0A6P7KH69_9TELE|nr:condensin-2 complex subunit G2 [Parambassis ranga]
MSKRELFLEAASKDNVEEFLRFIQLHKDKTEPFDVEEVVQEMTRDQREALWGKLASLLQDTLLELPPECWEQRKDDDMQEEPAADPKHVMAVVEGVTLVAAESLKVLQDGDTYVALLQIAHMLHDILVSLPVTESPLQFHIHTLCVAWWKKELQGKEKFGRTAFILSLQRSFTLKKPGAEIQRVWSLHNVLLGLDYTREENQQITDLLLQCFHSPFYIRSDDGKRFLVFLFSWNIDFIWVIHATMKNQLEFYSKTMMTHITEIYFRAWKKASGEFIEKIESTCIQDFMQSAILLHRSSPVHAKVRQILSYFHMRKGSQSVDKMLYNLYRPILWKFLSASNFEVRANATLLFTEAFPVHDPDQSNENIDQNIQKQLDTAMGLLDDPHPTVRSTAILGVCKILAKCWELLPPTVITDFLKKLVMELSADSSSPDVRCSVFKCLTIVLDNALCHPLLEKLLPTVKYSLHDTSEKVRAAFLDMLIKVKAVRAAKFWDVCSMEHLLARLAVDSHSVSKRIVDLLFKSFFPVNESEKEWCCRCITLIQMNPMAARKFYQFAYKHTAPTNIIKLMLAIRRVLNSCIQIDCDQSDLNESNKENGMVAPVTLGKDKAVVSGLLEVLVILWESVKKPLKQNEEAQKYTFAKFGSVMSKYFQAFEDEQAVVPLIQLASFMPPAAVPTFSCGVLSKLRRMDSGAGPSHYGLLLDCICSWNQTTDIVELITDWLTEALPKQGEKATGSRKVQIQETVEAKPDLALAYLEYLFSQTSTREKVLVVSQRLLKQLHTVLGSWKTLLYSHLSGTNEDPKCPSVDAALKALMLHGRLSAHLQHSLSEERYYLLSLENVAAWVVDRVLPFLTKSTDDGGEDSSQPLAIQITESFLTVCRDLLLVGLGDEKFKGQILHLCSLVLLSETGYLCIPAVLPILKEVANSYVPEDQHEDQENQEDPTTVILGVVANIFQKIIELLARLLRKEPEEGRQLCQLAHPGLTDFLQVAQMWDRAPLSGVFSTMFAVIIVEKRHSLQKITHPEEVITPESVEDMPPFSSTLLSIILKSSSITRSFLAEVSSSLDSEAITGLLELAAVLHVFAVIKHMGLCKSVLRTAAISVQQQLHKHVGTSVDGKGIQRVIYESSVTTLNDILHS